MIQTLVAKRLAAIALSVAISSGIPLLTQRHPKLVWLEKLGPVILDITQQTSKD